MNIAQRFLNKVGEGQAHDLMYNMTPSYFRNKSEELKLLGVPRSIDISADVAEDRIVVEFTDQSSLVFIGDIVEAW